jgi:F420-non-reducing hydrogenase small subunit
MSKPKVGFYWCASCGGCEEAIVDLNEGVLKVVEAVDIALWPVAIDTKRADVEAMPDGTLTACFINGAIRTSEQVEMAHLLRRKAGVLIAFGSCSHTGGIPGLANFYERESILARVYDTTPSTDNPSKQRPQTKTAVPEGTATLPTFYADVRTLDQTVDVDYYIPGCPPPVRLIVDAVTALLEGKLPPKGSILAPNIALCDECPRRDSKPDHLAIKEFKRPHEVIIDPEKCLLEQGLLCLGPATRSGCDAACISGNMPCTGCMGATDGIRDFGAKALSALSSLVDAREKPDIERILDTIPDPAGSFYRYSLPASLLHRRMPTNGNGGGVQ